MALAIRKNFFNWSPEEFENVLMVVLEEMKFTNILVNSAGQTAKAIRQETIKEENQTAAVRFDTNVKWTCQSEGVSVYIRIEDSEHDWTRGSCDKLASAVIGTIKTICEAERGIDD